MSIYRTAEWRTLRAKILAARPVCQSPGCSAPSSHIDHIVPMRSGGAAFSPANLQALCQRCHNRKTAMVDGGFGNRQRGGVPLTVGFDDKGNPVDPRHPFHR